MEPVLPLETDAERTTRQRIEARRQRAEDRRQHFLDPSTLKSGVRKSEIEGQLYEQSIQREAERLAAERMEAEKKRFLAEAARLEYARECERKLKLQQNAAFCLKASQARPPPSPKEPIRKGDHDQDLGFSSAQILAGEDLQQPERRKLQQIQMREWIAAQKDILDEKRRQEYEEEQEFAREVARNVAKGNQLEAERQAWDRQKLLERTNLNQQMATQRRERERAEDAERSRFIALEETSTMGFLKQAADNSYPFTYRGMTPDEVEKVKEQQLAQILENEQRRQAEREEELGWIRRHEATTKLANECAYRDEMDRKRIEGEQANYNEKLMLEKRERDVRERTELREGKTTEQFFSCFGRMER